MIITRCLCHGKRSKLKPQYRRETICGKGTFNEITKIDLVDEMVIFGNK